MNELSFWASTHKTIQQTYQENSSQKVHEVTDLDVDQTPLALPSPLPGALPVVSPKQRPGRSPRSFQGQRHRALLEWYLDQFEPKSKKRSQRCEERPFCYIPKFFIFFFFLGSKVVCCLVILSGNSFGNPKWLRGAARPRREPACHPCRMADVTGTTTEIWIVSR